MEADGRAVIVGSADLTAQLAKPILQNRLPIAVDIGKMFFSSVLVICHYMSKAYPSPDPCAVVLGRGTVSAVKVSSPNSPSSVLVSCTPAGRIEMPVRGSASLGILKDLDALKVFVNINKGLRSAFSVLPADPVLISEFVIQLDVEGCSIITRNATPYDPSTKYNSTVSEIDTAWINPNVTMPDDPVSAASLRKALEAIAFDSQPSKCLQVTCEAGKIVDLRGAWSTGSGASEWERAANFRSGDKFLVLQSDVAVAMKSAKRLGGLDSLVLRADSRGLLVFEFSNAAGSYSIAIPHLFPGSESRAATFSRPVSETTTSEAPIDGAIEIAAEQPNDDAVEEPDDVDAEEFDEDVEPDAEQQA